MPQSLKLKKSLFLRLKFESGIFDLGRLFFFASGIAIGIIILNSQEKLFSDWIYGISIMVLIAFNWTVKRFYKDEFMVRFAGIIGTNALLITYCFKYLSDCQTAMVFSLFAIGLMNYEFLWFNFKKKSLTVANEIVLHILYFVFVFLGTLTFIAVMWRYTDIEIGLICLGFSTIEGYVLSSRRWKYKSEEMLPRWGSYNLLNSELLIFNALLFGFSYLKFEYTTVYLVVLAVTIQLGFQKFDEFKRYNPYSFLSLVAAIGITIYLTLDSYATPNEQTVLYILQGTTILFSIIYSYLLFKSKKDESKTFSTILPYPKTCGLLHCSPYRFEKNSCQLR